MRGGYGFVGWPFQVAWWTRAEVMPFKVAWWTIVGLDFAGVIADIVLFSSRRRGVGGSRDLQFDSVIVSGLAFSIKSDPKGFIPLLIKVDTQPYTGGAKFEDRLLENFEAL